MKRVIAKTLDRAMGSRPARLASKFLTDDKVRVLAYHGIDDPATFARQMQYVRDQFEPISLHDLLAARRGLASLPDRALLVTFDDGERSVLYDGVPILERFAIPAVTFVIAGALRDPVPFWWDEVAVLTSAGASSERHARHDAFVLVQTLKSVADEERLGVIRDLRRSVAVPAPPCKHVSVSELHDLISHGVAVGNHSLTHPCLVRCSGDKITEEIDRSHAILSEVLGSPPVAFAYPNGDCDDRVRDALERRGYELGFRFDHQLTDMGAQWADLSRLRVNSHTSLERFAAILSGAHPALHRWRGRR